MRFLKIWMIGLDGEEINLGDLGIDELKELIDDESMK